MDDTHIKINYATTFEQKEKIYQFRYKVYIEEMGKSIEYADHVNRCLKDDLDADAHHFFIEHHDKVIASVRINILEQTQLSSYWKQMYHLRYFEEYPLKNLSISSKLMIDKNHRGSNVLGMLLFHLLQFAKEQGVKFDFCNCSPHLIEMYEHLGYRRYCKGFMNKDTGYHSPMVLLLDDLDHLKATRSPFYRVLKKYENNEKTRIWFEKQFPSHTEFMNRRLVSTEEFWNSLENKISTNLQNFSQLFVDMREDEVKKFVGMSTTLKYSKGEVIIRPGDVGKEMYVILTGISEVKSSLNDDALSLSILHEGQVFGEMAFVSHSPRNAAVIAETDVEVLVLTQAFFHKIMRNAPEITAKILLNLSVVLCERLQSSTNNWIESVQK